MVETAAVGRPAYTECLPRIPESARTARRLVSWALHVWGLEAVEDSAQLVVTELMANAVAHARMSMVRVTVSRMSETQVRVAVVDRSRDMPKPLAVSLNHEWGRGLTIVDALCEGRWGTAPQRWGKSVWAELTAKETSCE